MDELREKAKIRCSYADCQAVYESDSINKSVFVNGICPICHRLGRVRPLEIVEKLKARQNYFHKSAPLNNLPINNLAVILEDIRSLGNVGSIFRTADAVGATHICLCGITGCPPRKEISKTALGAEQDIAWQYFHDPLEAISVMKNCGFIIIGLEKNEFTKPLVQTLKEEKLAAPICLVLGNEVSGLSPEIMQSCNYVCHLPMKGKKESLNVASAFAVAAYLINELAIPNTVLRDKN